MDKEQLEDEWRKLSEEVLAGMQEWRLQHPNATLREIEMVVHERMMQLEARMVENLAVKSPAVDWSKQASEEKPRCQQCGSILVSRGKQKRRLQTNGGKAIELERSYGVCPTCGVGLFPPG